MKALVCLFLGLFVASGCVVERYYPAEDTNEGDAGNVNKPNNNNSSSVEDTNVTNVTDADITDPVNTVSPVDTGSETVSTVPVDTGLGDVPVDTGTNTGMIFDPDTGSAVDTGIDTGTGSAVDTGIDTGTGSAVDTVDTVDTGVDTTSFVDTVDTGIDTDTRPDCEFVCVNKGTCPASGIGGDGIPHREMSCGIDSKVCCDDHSQDPTDISTLYPDCAYTCVEASLCSGDAWEPGVCDTGVCCSDYAIDTESDTDTGADTDTGVLDPRCARREETFNTDELPAGWFGDWCWSDEYAGSLPYELLGTGILNEGHVALDSVCVAWNGNANGQVSILSREYFMTTCTDVTLIFTYFYNVMHNAIEEETTQIKLIGDNGTSYSIIPWGEDLGTVQAPSMEYGTSRVRITYGNLLPGALSFRIQFMFKGHNGSLKFDNVIVYH